VSVVSVVEGVKDRGTNVEHVIAAAATANSVLGTGFMARALTPHRRTCAAAAAISEPSLCPRISRHGSKQSRKDLRQHIHTRSGVSYVYSCLVCVNRTTPCISAPTQRRTYAMLAPTLGLRLTNA
jgi:hypothetical protein